MLSTKPLITTLFFSTMAMLWCASSQADPQQEPMTTAESLAATMQGALDDPLLIWLVRTAIGIFVLFGGHFALRWASRKEPQAHRSNSHHRYLRHHH
jgi:hypothetical protein